MMMIAPTPMYMGHSFLGATLALHKSGTHSGSTSTEFGAHIAHTRTQERFNRARPGRCRPH